jgi:hypothetical protein
MNKTTALIAAAALALGTAAMAQQTQPADNASTRGETTAAPNSMKPADDAQRTKDSLHRLGDKTRRAMHRAGDKVRDVAKNDKNEHHDRHARADRHDHDRYARADRHHRHDRDTSAMGAQGAGMRGDTRADMRADMRDADASRRDRMDEAYANWKARQKNG